MSINHADLILSLGAPPGKAGCRRCGGLMVPEVFPESNLLGLKWLQNGAFSVEKSSIP